MRLVFLAGVTLGLAIATINACAQVAGGMINMNGITQSSSPRNPYSADTTTIRDQVLADGNRIHRESHGKIYRDSQGRIRNEMEVLVPAGQEPFTLVNINDPVQRLSISFSTREHVAQINHFPDPQKVAAEAPIQKPSQATPRLKSELKREDLGTQDIEGVQARGWRTIRTIPAGAEGNDAAIEVVDEIWMAQELGVSVLTKTTDPRNGTTERRLVNIQRGEPDPMLFEAPADYKIKENGTPQ